MSVYVEILTWVSRAYANASNGFHPPEAAKKIGDALDGFETTFERLAADGAKTSADSGAIPNAAPLSTDDALRVLDAQFTALKSAVASATRADDAKIKNNRVDQLAHSARAQCQQAADGELLSEISKLMGQVRNDAAANISPASSTWPVPGIPGAEPPPAGTNPGVPYASEPNTGGGYG
jgi:hypothetical protein